MRDVRPSSRSIVTLDRAQLVGLGFFAVLSGGLMFGLGYSAGKVPRTEQPKGEPPVLSQIDAEHALHQKMKEDKVDYTYFKALVARDEKPQQAKANDKPVASLDPVKAPESKDAAKAGDSKAEAKEFAKAAEAKELAKAVDAKAEAKEPAKAAELGDAMAAKELKLPAELEPKEPTFATAMAPTSPSAPAEQAMAKPLPLVKPAAPASKLGEFTIQVSAFKSEGEAGVYVSKLQQKGFQAFVTPSEVQGKGTWYRVRVGHFASKTAAELYKQKLDHDNVPAWIVKAD